LFAPDLHSRVVPDSADEQLAQGIEHSEALAVARLEHTVACLMLVAEPFELGLEGLALLVAGCSTV